MSCSLGVSITLDQISGANFIVESSLEGSKISISLSDGSSQSIELCSTCSQVVILSVDLGLTSIDVVAQLSLAGSAVSQVSLCLTDTIGEVSVMTVGVVQLQGSSIDVGLKGSASVTLGGESGIKVSNLRSKSSI